MKNTKVLTFIYVIIVAVLLLSTLIICPNVIAEADRIRSRTYELKWAIIPHMICGAVVAAELCVYTLLRRCVPRLPRIIVDVCAILAAVIILYEAWAQFNPMLNRLTNQLFPAAIVSGFVLMQLIFDLFAAGNKKEN